MMTLQQTRIAINFVVEDDSDQIIAFLAALTALIQGLLTVARPVYWFVVDWSEALVFTAKVWVVWFNAFAYGLVGLRL